MVNLRAATASTFPGLAPSRTDPAALFQILSYPDATTTVKRSPADASAVTIDGVA